MVMNTESPLDFTLSDTNLIHKHSTTAIIQHMIVTSTGLPNALKARLPVQTNLNVDAWDHFLTDYHDGKVSLFLRYGWPINYTKDSLPRSSHKNHPSADNFPQHVEYYINTELSYNAIAGPFDQNPLHQDLICSPLQTVPKRGSTTRRVVMDLSFPEGLAVNNGIPSNIYMEEPYKLRLPGIDRLCTFILQHGQGCFIYKKDLKRAYRQLPVDPKDYNLLGFTFNNKYYFDMRCPFGLRSSAMICQRTTSAVIHIFSQLGFTADVYLDDFYGAETPTRAESAFQALQTLFDHLGLQSSQEKDCRPSTKMICLGIEVDTLDFCLRVPQERIQDLLSELDCWVFKHYYSIKELQSLLGKLSFVTACVPAGRIFMSRLLNHLRCFPKGKRQAKVTQEIRLDITWWIKFLPEFNGISIIKEPNWNYVDLHFTTDACLQSGGATCLNECFHVSFNENIIALAGHISGLELFVIVVAARTWATVLSHRRVLVSCDNTAAVTAINSGRSKDPFMQRCLRQLWMISALHDFELRASHIPGVHNSLADALSRWHIDTKYQDNFYAECAKRNLSYTFVDVSPQLMNFQID